MAPDRADRVAKGSGHVVLVRPTQVDQADHGVGFGHAITRGILRQGNPRNENHAVIILGLEKALSVNNLRAFWVSCFGEKIVAAGIAHTA